MKKNFSIKSLCCILAGLALLASCEKSEEMSAAIAYDKIPGTNIVEGQLGSVVYTYEDWLDCTAGSYYVMDAIYDCYVAKGKTHYVVNPRDGYPDNTNQMMGMEGFLPASLQFHDGYYSYAGGYEGVVKLYAYTFDEASQALSGVFEYHHLEGLPKTLVYLTEECFVLQTGKAWGNRSAEKGATFSRVVYKRCAASEVPVLKDTVDCRQ